MIVGIGNDIVHISRIARSLEQYGDRFLDKLFTPEERKYCDTRSHRAQHYAVRFAAKEAFSKAIGTGWNEQFGWKDISIERSAEGKPSIRLQGNLAKKWGTYHLHLSMSHSDDTALATVVIEEMS